MEPVTVKREDGVALVTIDVRGEPVNTLSRPVRDAFAAAMESLQADAAVRAVVIMSGKPDNFFAGADIEEFVAAKTAADLTKMSREGQALLDRLAAPPKPIVVAINGTCLGGGVELALACHYRVASNHPKTALGCPEVQLGIIPGAGGCNRLPRLIGVRAAVDLILTARNVKAERALRMGLVDEVVAPAILRDVAVGAARRLAERGMPPRKGRPPEGWVKQPNDTSREPRNQGSVVKSEVAKTKPRGSVSRHCLSFSAAMPIASS